MATLHESPCAKNIREALLLPGDCSANLVNSKSEMLRRIFRLSKQDTGKDDTPLEEEAHAQEDAEAAEPPTDFATATETLAVPQHYVKDTSPEPPDQFAEEIASQVNEMALRDVSKPSKPSALGKRKRQRSDQMENPPMEDAKTTEAPQPEDEPHVTSRNRTTGHQGGSNPASLEAPKVAPGKLPRPNKMPRHMIRANPQWAPSGDEYDLPPTPGKQVDKPATTPTKATTKPSSTKVTPRGRGRPPLVGASANKKTSSIEKGRGGQDTQVTPGRKRKAGPKTAPKTGINLAGDKRDDKYTSRNTRSTAAAKGSKNVHLDMNNQVKTFHASNEGQSTQARGKNAVNGVQKDQSSDVEAGPGSQNRATSSQNEGEESEGDDSKTRGRKNAERVVNSAGQKSRQTDEGDEGQLEDVEDDPDTEYLTEASEIDGEENEDEELELFGQDKAWKTVLDGARSKCNPKLPLNQMPKRLTGSIKDLVYEVNKARSSYEQLLPFKGLGHRGLEELNDDLTKSFNAIEDQIKKLSERNAAGEATKFIKHLFTCAIPAMVFLLKSALASRLYHSNEPCTLESLNETVHGLGEIVRLQKMTILLCEKALYWKAKSDPSIKGPTTRKILPGLRNMRKVFSNVLLEQNRKRKMKQNALDYRLRQETLTKSPQQAKQEAARKDVTWQMKIRRSREQEDQNRRNERRTLKQVREDEARARIGSVGVNGHVESKAIWSDAEDLALYFQLEKGYAGYLTSTERYLNILNTPLLQNKLPEHIRDRALYFKPTLLEQRGALEWISSIE